MSESQELWQKRIYDSRKEIYQTTSLPERDGPRSLLLTYREHMRMLRRLELKNSDRILDIGCSSGTWLNYLAARYGCKGTGMDISSEAISAARNRNPFNHEFLEGSADRPLPFEDGSFNHAVSFDVLEHLHSPQQALAELFRVLKPGGRILLHIPVTDIRGSVDWILSRWNPRKFNEGLKSAGHDYARMLTRKGYEEAVREAGFSKLHSQRYNAVFQNIFDYHVTHRVLNRLFYLWNLPFQLYHRAAAPLIELALCPDRLLHRMDIGASIYIVAEKPRG